MIPTQSHSLECENSVSNVHVSDNGGNSSQEQYESCNEVLSESDAEEEVDPLLDESNDYYHCMQDHDSSSDESGSDVDCNEPQSSALRVGSSNWTLRNNITHKAINELLKIFIAERCQGIITYTPYKYRSTRGRVFTLRCRTNFNLLC